LLEDRDFRSRAGMRAVDAVQGSRIDPEAGRGNQPKR
jgi:hypothetical protein